MGGITYRFSGHILLVIRGLLMGKAKAIVAGLGSALGAFSTGVIATTDLTLPGWCAVIAASLATGLGVFSATFWVTNKPE